jgi:iron complex transport system substrate-binding protein
MRVASLLPAATELLYALGIEPVCRSHSCDYPPAARDLPAVTDTVIDHEDATAGDIDDQMLAVDGSPYRLDAERLAALEPDVVVTQSTCEVCAVDVSAVRAAVTDPAVGADLVTMDPHSLEEFFEAVDRLGGALGVEDAASSLLGDLRARTDRVTDLVTDQPDRPRVTVLDWTDPVMVAGHWVPGLVEQAGGTFGPPDLGPASRPVEFERVRAYDPEVLVVAPCGFERDRAVEAVADLAHVEGFGDVTAVREDQVYAVDGSALLNRPGPRLVDSLEVLAACLHRGTVSADGGYVSRVPVDRVGSA